MELTLVCSPVALPALTVLSPHSTLYSVKRRPIIRRTLHLNAQMKGEVNGAKGLEVVWDWVIGKEAGWSGNSLKFQDRFKMLSVGGLQDGRAKFQS